MNENRFNGQCILRHRLVYLFDEALFERKERSEDKSKIGYVTEGKVYQLIFRSLESRCASWSLSSLPNIDRLHVVGSPFEWSIRARHITCDHGQVDTIWLLLHHHLEKKRIDCFLFSSIVMNSFLSVMYFWKNTSILNSDWVLEICRSHFRTFNQNDSSQKGMDKKLVDHLSSSRPRTDVYRTRSLIKPPPPRSSWELLLDEYLKDPNARSVGSPNLTAVPQPPAFHLFSQPASPDTFEPPFLPSPYPAQLPSTRHAAYQMNSDLPRRRCQLTPQWEMSKPKSEW